MLIDYTKWAGKWLSFLMLVLSGIWIFLIGIEKVYFYATDTVPKSKVKITVEYDEKKCGQEIIPEDGSLFSNPRDNQTQIHIVIDNGSSKVIARTDFILQAYKRGHSTNLTDGRISHSDDIIGPNDSISGCISVPFSYFSGKMDYSKLDYEVSVENILFASSRSN